MTTPAYADDLVTVHHGDCLDVLATLPDASIDAVVTDPPYGLEFMGKEWDRPWAVSPTQGVGFAGRQDNLTLPSFGDNRNANCRACGGRQRGVKRCTCASPKWDRDPAEDMRAFQSWCTEWAAECLRVLKPGGHLLAFGGTRTWHRLACAVEDAGFEVRDSIAWLYGQGFPKSLDVSKAIDKAAGAEREVVGSQPVSRLTRGSGALVGGVVRSGEIDVTAPATPDAATWQGWGTALKPAFEPIVVARKPLIGTVAQNVLAHGTGALNIDGCRVGFASSADEAESKGKNRHADFGTAPGGNEVYGDYTMVPRQNYNPPGRWPANVVLDESQAAELDKQSGSSVSRVGQPRGAASGEGWGMTATGAEYDDTGGASRFFYTPKATSSERPRHIHDDGHVAHPTVKPVDLMRWLVRLVTPPGGVVLDPFAGSGTTGEACIIEGFDCILIEREADYLPLIKQRLSKPIQQGLPL